MQEEKSPLNSRDKEGWAKIIAEWEQSEENQKKFCSRLNLNHNSFSYWRGKLLAEKNNHPAKKAKFIPLTIKKTPEIPLASEEKCMIIATPNGNKLYIPLSAPIEQLNLVLKLLGFANA